MPEQRNAPWALAGLGVGDQQLEGGPAEGLLRALQYGGCMGLGL